MNIVTATKSNNTLIALVNDEGKIKQVPATSDHPKWAEILKAWAASDYDALLELLSLKRVMEKYSCGDLVVGDQGVFYKDMPLVGVDVDRIMAFMRVGDPYQPIANYMERKLKNPSKRAIDEMYNFLEHKQMSLTPSGTFIAYKGVHKNFYSVSKGQEPLISGSRNEEGQIFNGVGETIEMDRAWVDDDFRKGCSGGLHAGSLEYAKDWARDHDGIIILIEIDPAFVVSVPEDCNCSKLRCCKYKVIGIYEGPLPDTYTADYSDTADQDNCPCESCESQTETQPDPMSHIQVNSSTNTDNVIDSKEYCDENNEFRRKFITIVCEQLGHNPDNIKDNMSFIDDLGADSLDMVELLISFEQEFDISIPEDIAESCYTIGQAIAKLRRIKGLPLPVKPESDSNSQSVERNEKDTDSYQQGYQKGIRDGVRRCKRLYREQDENNQYGEGYCDGYRAGRKDYKQK